MRKKYGQLYSVTLGHADLRIFFLVIH